MNPNRNPGMGRAEVEDTLRRYLGVSTVIWLGSGVYLDETGGHIDELACFTSPGHVALTWTEDRNDPQYEISQDAYERLRHARDARGRRLTIHKIHQPGPLFMTAEEAAGVDAREGTHPRRALKRLFPSREVVGVPTREVLLGGGNVHCITQQVPRPASA